MNFFSAKYRLSFLCVSTVFVFSSGHKLFANPAFLSAQHSVVVDTLNEIQIYESRIPRYAMAKSSLGIKDAQCEQFASEIQRELQEEIDTLSAPNSVVRVDSEIGNQAAVFSGREGLSEITNQFLNSIDYCLFKMYLVTKEDLEISVHTENHQTIVQVLRK